MAFDQGSRLPASRKRDPRRSLAEIIVSDWGTTVRVCLIFACVVGSVACLLAVSSSTGLGFALLGAVTAVVQCYLRRGPGSGPAGAAVPVRV